MSTLQRVKFTKCKLYNVLYVPDRSCNLLSISQVTGSRKTAKFTDAGSEILDENQKLIATACRIGSLYYLDGMIIWEQKDINSWQE